MSEDKDEPITYRTSGVDIDAGNRLVEAIKPLVRATARPGSDCDIGGFGGLFDLRGAGYKDPILVAASDGVGTKLRIAIETGIHDTVGIDLVAMCVNDLVVQGAEPLFFLDYYACATLDEGAAEAVVTGIAEGCRQARCALIGGETAEMPGMYAKGDYDLAGFAVGAAERGELLPTRSIEPGDLLLGLASGGLHSNGFSLVRKIVSEQGLDWSRSTPFSATDDAGKSIGTLGEALLLPTRIYVQSVLQAIWTAKGIKALAHITGGGLTENIPRVLPDGVVARLEAANWTAPAVFSWLQGAAGLDDAEMLKTFNCGIGMVLVVSPGESENIAQTLERAGETVYRIGEIIPGEGPSSVRYRGQLEFVR